MSSNISFSLRSTFPSINLFLSFLIKLSYVIRNLSGIPPSGSKSYKRLNSASNSKILLLNTSLYSKIKISSTQTRAYQTPYRIPTTWTGTDASNALYRVFYQTWWTYTSDPSINTTYYTSNTVV